MSFDPSLCVANRCPDPALCVRVQRHLHDELYRLYHESPQHREAWDRLAGLAATVSANRVNRVFAKPACVFLGDKLAGQPCGSTLHKCLYDGIVCSRLGNCIDAKRSCQTCDYHQVPPADDAHTWQWISTAKLIRDAIAFAGRLPEDAAGIVGVPRSGMLPAAAIATHLHLPLWSLEDGELVRLRVNSSRGNGVSGGTGKLVFIDDTVYSGASFDRLKKFKSKAVFAAIYVRKSMERTVDLFHQAVPNLHVLEWNWANNGPLAGRWHSSARGYAAGIAADLDGIICHDAESSGKPGTPFMLPRANPIPLIATGRQERHRKDTESWLRKWGVKWMRLEMLPDSAPFTAAMAAEHKAHHFAASGCGAFIESCPWQAETIHQITGRPVICPIIEKVFQWGPPTVSLIIPTIGRETLRGTLQSLVSQPWQPGDEIIVVGDGPQSNARGIWSEFKLKLPGRFIETSAPANDWGGTPRNFAMGQASGSHLAALDDDDVWTPTALTSIRQAIVEHPDQPHMFRAKNQEGAVVPSDDRAEVGNVGTPLFVAPNRPDRMGKWGTAYTGDFDFISATMARYPEGSLVWHPEVIVSIRPPVPSPV